MQNFPHRFYFFGSKDSIDTDALIEVDELLPVMEDNKRLLKELKEKHSLDWNANLITIGNGMITGCIAPKSSPDSLNNALLATYGFHKQPFPCPVQRRVKRNKSLATYKALRTCLAQLTRHTELRPIIRPTMKGIHPFKRKMESFEAVDYCKTNSFGQKVQNDANCWKTTAFYLVQNVALWDEVEIYSKSAAVDYCPWSEPFIYRRTLSEKDRVKIQTFKNDWLTMINALKFNNVKEGQWYSILEHEDERIDMHHEIALP